MDSPDIQGDDSYVVFRAVTGAERDALFAGRRDDEPESAIRERGRRLLALRILDWNWVDEAGQPLPLPKDDVAVFDRLLEHELDFLMEHGSQPI